MQDLSILKINEIFWSFQGEGLRAGIPSIFLRLAGCQLRCPYCDTREAWEGGVWMPLDDILAQIDLQKKKYPASQVVITGGEPLEQELETLVTGLKERDYFVTVETNGIEYYDLPIDWWTVSPKDVSGYNIHDDLKGRIDEVKLIVNKNLTVDVVKQIRKIGHFFPIFLQPDSTDSRRYENTFYFFEQCQEKGIKDVRPGIQLHKVYRVK